MGKGKNKRKRERAKQRAQQEAEQVPLSDPVVVPAKEEEKTPATAKPKRSSKKESPMGLREMVKRPSLTDWCIMFFTGVLAAAAIYQFIIMGGQLDTMRKDQRPWVKVINATPNGISLAENQTVLGSVQLFNSGKTPAKNVHLDLNIKKLGKDEIPSLDWDNRHVFAETGMIFPNISAPQLIDFGIAKEEQGGKVTEFIPISKDDVRQFNSGDIYFVIYAKVTYSDFFGTNHWTQFCEFRVNGLIHAGYPASSCPQYNDVDNN